MADTSVAQQTPAARERRFYTRMAWFIVLVVLAGFAPSFYLKWTGLSYPRPNPPLVPNLMLHGLVFSAWVAVFVVQVSLVAAGRRDLHRRLGVLGMALGVALVPVMYLTAVWAVARGGHPPFTDALTWTAVPLVPIPAYVLMLWLGWRESRRDLQAHKRLMLSLMIMLCQPAIGRLPLGPPDLLGFTLQCLLNLLVFVPLFLWDRRTLGHLHWATRFSSVLFALAMAIQLYLLARPGIWSSFVVLLPGI